MSTTTPYTQISNFTESLWRIGRKTKQTIGGWISGNAVCCQHNGETQDNRGRGGIISNGDGSITYACFNCNYRASYIPGHTLSINFRRLLRWMGASDAEIERIIIESHRIRQQIDPFDIQPIQRDISFTPDYDAIDLPETFVSFKDIFTLLENNPEDVPISAIDTIEYAVSRNLDLNNYEYYWDASQEYPLKNRLIVPFYWEGKLVGHTARTMEEDNRVKYMNHMPHNFVFNMDKQSEKSEFVIVTEGIFDAIAVDGVAVMHNTANDQQARFIESLGKEVIVVPDFDNGPGKKLILDGIERDWAVSFPVWHETCKDINEAVGKYGKLFVLKSIVDAVETSRLKIRLKTKTIYGSKI